MGDDASGEGRDGVIYKCCPSGAEVDIDGLASGKLGSVTCLRCGRWFIGSGSSLYRANAPMGWMAGDLYVDPDGSFHTSKKAIRDLIESLAHPDSPEAGTTTPAGKGEIDG